jgi:hypothetical protein
LNASVLAACLLAFSLPALGQIYKSVDDKGRVTYSEKPSGRKDHAVTRPDATGGTTRKADPARETRKLQQQEQDFQRRQRAQDRDAERARRERERRETPAAERARLTECRRANTDLKNIRSNPTAHSFAEEAKVKERISRYCS